MRNLVGYQDLPEEIRNQINEVTEIWKKRVKDHLVGVYLHGSISLEAFHPESGDIDILVVVKDSLTVEEKLDIAKDIIEIDGHPRPIEISAIKEEDAKNWKTPGNCVFHYSDFWTEKYRNRFSNPDEGVYVVDQEFPDADVTSVERRIATCLNDKLKCHIFQDITTGLFLNDRNEAEIRQSVVSLSNLWTIQRLDKAMTEIMTFEN